MRRSLTYANAGHNPPLLVRTGGEVERLADGGTVMGVFPDAVYAGSKMSLAAGDRLIFYTDGITEARDPEGSEFGEDRLAAAALEARLQDADGLKDYLVRAVETFTGGVFEDDATMIAVEIG